MVSIWPIMRRGGADWAELHDHGFLLGNQATYDAFNPAARACYWKQANAGLFPTASMPGGVIARNRLKPIGSGRQAEPEEQMRIDTEEAKRYLDPEYINAYSLLHSQGIYEGQRAMTSRKRVVNLTRSAYAGQHRYATITWSGDIVATWETLRRQIPAGLNFCATGLPYWTLDIGGFFVKRKPDLWFWCGDYDEGVEDLGYRELYVRWFQYAAFLPMFRAHGTDTPREIWRFGQPGEPMYETLVKFLRLRYRLMPYIYSLAGLVTLQDYTMLRALPFDFRHDPNTYDITDQFMFGPAFLVNPVTQPMYYAANSTPLEGVEKTRPVYLPRRVATIRQTLSWYDFWTGERHSGGQTILADAPLETMPVFVRAGSIIPVGPDIQFTGDQPDAPLELWVYPGQDGQFTLYEDEGDNYNYEQGHFATIHLTWKDQRPPTDSRQAPGKLSGNAHSTGFRVVIASHNRLTLAAAQAPSARTLRYEGQHMVVDF